MVQLLTMTEVPKPDRERLQAFQALRSEVHRQMETKIQARLDEGRDRPTDLELELDAFEEEIEPQVLTAVKIMNRKGYTTISSGFAGDYGERQQIDGPFFVDDATKERLAFMGVSVILYPDPYMPGQMIIFSPEKPSLPE